MAYSKSKSSTKTYYNPPASSKTKSTRSSSYGDKGKTYYNPPSASSKAKAPPVEKTYRSSIDNAYHPASWWTSGQADKAKAALAPKTYHSSIDNAEHPASWWTSGQAEKVKAALFPAKKAAAPVKKAATRPAARPAGLRAPATRQPASDKTKGTLAPTRLADKNKGIYVPPKSAIAPVRLADKVKPVGPTDKTKGTGPTDKTKGTGTDTTRVLQAVMNAAKAAAAAKRIGGALNPTPTGGGRTGGTRTGGGGSVGGGLPAPGVPAPTSPPGVPPVVRPPAVQPPAVNPGVPTPDVGTFTNTGRAGTYGRFLRQRRGRGPMTNLSLTPEMIRRMAMRRL